MSPKEKAKELIDKFSIGINFDCLISVRVAHQIIPKAKKCALICVDEIMKDIDNYSLESTDESYRLDKLYFWQQVKQEIKKI